jgi:amino acid transporter
METNQPSSGGTARVVVATTVALSFISFWRGAAIVLNDLASSAFYAGGIAELAIGKSAPWFILGVMLFSFAVRSVYMEGSSMFVRGGVYVVVRDSMGKFMARLSVSALIFDFILTGPISGVTAGQYLGRLLNETAEILHSNLRVNPNLFAEAVGVVATAYFWRSNIRGIHESSGKALRIMQIMTVMVGIFLVWCPLTILLHGPAQVPPLPNASNLHLGEESLGWFQGTFWASMPMALGVMAFGHSLLSMSGFETLAQVYREIAYPKLKNLKLTANTVCIYAVVSTGVVTVFAGYIIPDNVRLGYAQNLLGGLAMYLAGPTILKLAFHMFVVAVGVLILSGAVNTSLIGANGILNRIAEDRVLVEWFRKPHSKFGTTYRLIDSIALLQVITIVLSGGDLYLLGEAYAFGVVWSFFLNSLGVLVLRFKRNDQEYKHPGNIMIGGREIPVGLISTTLVLFVVALANLGTKKVATIYGIAFTLLLFAVFTISEYVNNRKKHATAVGEAQKELEAFNLDVQPEIDDHSVHARPGCVMVAVRDYTQIYHLQSVLRKTNLRRHDIVVVTVRVIGGTGGYDLRNEQIFDSYERQLFSRVVEMAEKEGKTVDLLVVPGIRPYDALVQTAVKLKASRIVTGVSPGVEAGDLAMKIGQAWERLPEPRPTLSLEAIAQGRPTTYVNLGPHPPRLWPEDVERVHELWLEVSQRMGSHLHHRDIVSVALRRLKQDLDSERVEDVYSDFDQEMNSAHGEEVGSPDQNP